MNPRLTVCDSTIVLFASEFSLKKNKLKKTQLYFNFVYCIFLLKYVYAYVSTSIHLVHIECPEDHAYASTL